MKLRRGFKRVTIHTRKSEFVPFRCEIAMIGRRSAENRLITECPWLLLTERHLKNLGQKFGRRWLAKD